jgi:hypothetical protein
VNVIEQNSAEIFDQFLAAISEQQIDRALKEKVEAAIREMKQDFGSGSFGDKYRAFVSLVADHLTILGPIGGPYLPVIANLIK